MVTRDGSREDAISQTFGPLEVQVLEAVWERGCATTVRDLIEWFPGSAYTTLMTTLDRLHKKGVLDRHKVSRAFAYQARYERDDLARRLAMRSIVDLFGAARGRRALEPVLSFFVDAVSEKDRQLLDDLERLLKSKRESLENEKPR